MFFVISGVVLLVFISILYFLLAIGMPFGYLAWGGKYKDVLPKHLRIQSAISIPAQLFSAYVLLKMGNVLTGDIDLIIEIFGYVFIGFFLINTIMNALSRSRKEKYVMTPIAFWIFICFVYVMFLI